MEEYIKIFFASVIGAGLGSSIITIIVNRKLQHHYDLLREKWKIRNVLVEKRYDSAVSALNSLSRLNQILVADLKKFEIPNDTSPVNKILQSFHPQYRAEFRAITSQLETVNDLFSVYRLSFDGLLHPKSLKKLLDNVRNPGNISDCKQAYRAIWQMVFDSLHAVLRVAQLYEFWIAESNYGKKAEEWAKFDERKFKDHFVHQYQDASSTAFVFTLSIEELNNFKEFLDGPSQKQD